MLVLDFINFFILGTIPGPVCRKHTTEILPNALQLKPWALHMLDSTAKIPAGLLTGNLIQYGNMDECLAVKASGDFGEFQGKFCMVRFPYEIKGHKIEYETGICMPSTCSAQDLQYFLKYAFHIQLNVEVDEIQCNALNEERPYQPKEIFTFFVITVLVLLVVLSTTYDYLKEKKHILFQAFSLKLLVKFLLDTSAPAAPLDFLHGLRSLAIAFVVLAHVYMIKLMVRNDINETRAIGWLSDWEHTWLTSRGTVVDAFFVMGGILTSYTFLKNRDRGRKFSLISYWVHRYMRMAPALAMQLLFEATLTNRLGSGPKWKTFAKTTEDACRRDWWKHMLFINNWWGIEKCMPHTWYIAADMQYNMLAPLLLIPLHRRPRLGLALALGAGIVSCFVTFGLAIGYEEKVDLFKNATSDIGRRLYRASYNRLIAWLTGFAMGYFMYKYQYLCVVSSEHKIITQIGHKLKKFLFVLVLWIICFGLLAIAIFAVHPFIQYDYKYNAVESATFLASTHILLAACSALGMTLVWMGYGAPFHILLTWKFFLPLSKLSYSMYLIHVLIINIRLFDARTTEYLSDFNLIMIWISSYVITLFVSPLLTLMVEYPFTLIEMVLHYRFSSDKWKPDPQAVASYGTIPPSQVSKSEGIVNGSFELAEDSRRRITENSTTGV